MLEIDTPERQFYNGEVTSVVLPARDGEFCILAGHQPMFMSIEVGVLKIIADGKEKYAFCSEGFAEILPQKIKLFSQACEWPDEIDLERAELAKKHAEDKLKHKESVAEHKYSEISLARATTRIKVGSFYNNKRRKP